MGPEAANTWISDQDSCSIPSFSQEATQNKTTIKHMDNESVSSSKESLSMVFVSACESPIQPCVYAHELCHLSLCQI